MSEFNRYVVTVDVESCGAEHGSIDELHFSVAAISESTVDSALPLENIKHVRSYEIKNIKKQNE